MRFAAVCLSFLTAVFCGSSCFGRDVVDHGVFDREATPSSGQSLTVLLDFEDANQSVSLARLQKDLQAILANTGLKLDVRFKQDVAAHAEFQQLVVFKMKGHCTARPLPIAALSDERGALAMTYSSDGTLLPFGAVECDRVRESLERVLGRNASYVHQNAYSTAIARVMAHEIYHMMGNSKQHTRDGVTKRSLSSRELYEGVLPLPDKARRQMVGTPAVR
jgi:hypothetical protein